MPDRLAQLNNVFWDLGLRFSWDEAMWTELARLPDLRAQLDYYLVTYQPHLLAVYDVEFLLRLIEEQLDHPGEPRTGMEAHKSI